MMIMMIINDHYVIRKSHDATEKNVIMWYHLIGLKQTRGGGKIIRRCGVLLGRVVHLIAITLSPKKAKKQKVKRPNKN